MKRMNIVFIIGLLLPQFVRAQGTLYVSNLGQPTVGSMAIGRDSWIAQPFSTGTNSAGYSLYSVELLMGAGSGNPAGFNVAIYSSLTPINNLGTLTGPGPSAGGLFTYTTSGIVLSPSTSYFLVATATTPAAQGAYKWSAADSFGRIYTTQGDPWSIPDSYESSTDGSSWTFNPRGNISQFAIYATPAPEPGVLSLLGLGGLGFLWQHQKAKWR